MLTKEKTWKSAYPEIEIAATDKTFRVPLLYKVTLKLNPNLSAFWISLVTVLRTGLAAEEFGHPLHRAALSRCSRLW